VRDETATASTGRAWRNRWQMCQHEVVIRLRIHVSDGRVVMVGMAAELSRRQAEVERGNGRNTRQSAVNATVSGVPYTFANEALLLRRGQRIVTRRG